jgi:hypothetical protein
MAENNEDRGLFFGGWWIWIVVIIVIIILICPTLFNPCCKKSI